MGSKRISSKFAPAERATREEVLRQAERFSRVPLLYHFISSIFDIVVVLNKERQIVLSNENLPRLLGGGSADSFLGFRPGEALQCVHASATASGCGTTEFCGTCGAAKAILTSQEGGVSIQECRMMRENVSDPLDLRVYASPLRVNGDLLTVFAVADISHEKRRRALERIFFHDVLNTAGGLHGFIELLEQTDPNEIGAFKVSLLQLSRELVEEIKAQRDLMAAENNELLIDPVPVDSLALMNELVNLYKNHEVARARHLHVDPNSKSLGFATDSTLLRRVVGNMVKNALEATGEGECVTIGCQTRKGGIEFRVHNPRYMPRPIQLQIFQRSFSTKGAHRGLGTYSMKLLGERYLQGRVSFQTSPSHGTVFKIWLPLTKPEG